MAILGVQLVFSMITASFLSKLSPHMSFARWLLCGKLVRYLHPSNEELRTLAGVPTHTGYGKGKWKRGDKKKQEMNSHSKDEFTVPRSTEIQLEAAPVQANDVIHLHFYTEYQWLIDFGLCAALVYSATEVYYALLQPKSEFNLGLLWCILVVLFALKVMLSVTAIYFRTEDAGERILCILSGFFFLIFAMGVLIIDENKLEFGLRNAYRNFTGGAKDFLESQGMDSKGPASELTFKITLAVFGAILGAFLTFPGLRYAKMFTDSIKYAQGSPFLQLLLYSSFIMPVLISLMWVKPLMRDYIVKEHAFLKGATITNDIFESTRLYLLLAFILLRLSLTTTHLQSHLNIAVDKVNQLKKEAGRISNTELQKMVARVFYYLCVVALQYLAPLIFLLFCTFMLKTLGDMSWTPMLNLDAYIPLKVSKAASAVPSIPVNLTDSTIATTATQFTLAWKSLQQVFTPIYFRGVFSFLCWWTCTAWFITSCFGMLYYSYFVSV